LNSKNKENSVVSLKSIYRVPGIIIVIVAIIKPFGIGTESSLIYYYVGLMAMTWRWDNGIPGKRGEFFSFNTPLECILTLPFTFLRFTFAYQLDRYYKNEIDKKTVYKWNYVSELPILIMSLLVVCQVLIFSLFPEPLILSFQIILPFPSVLLLGLLMIHFIPPPMPPSIWAD
jgi:hypothetical protein